MIQVANWSRRKLEIADAFRQAAPLETFLDWLTYKQMHEEYIT